MLIDYKLTKKDGTPANWTDIQAIFYSMIGNLLSKRYKLILAPSRKKGRAWAKQHGFKSDEFKLVTPQNFYNNIRGMFHCDLYLAGEHVELTRHQWEDLALATQ